MRHFIFVIIVTFVSLHSVQAEALNPAIEQNIRVVKIPALSKIYSEQDYAPIWIGENDLSPHAEEFIQILEHIEEDGLDPESYHLAAIKQLRAKSNYQDLAKLDILLSRSLLQLISDLRFGRTALRKADSALDQGFRIEQVTLDKIFREAVNSGKISRFIQTLLPEHSQYQRMKRALAQYRKLVQEGGWPSVPVGPALKPGAEDSRIPMLAERLKVSGDLDPKYEPKTLYDGELVRAVEHFQSRHGLPVDGVLGKESIQMMNISAEERLRTLLINLERWRWLSLDLGKRFFIVNIAGFELLVIEDGRPIYRTPVIVGKQYQMTPVFSDLIRAIEFNPYWNVPLSIASKEILPKLKQNPGYLAAQHMEVLQRAGRGQNRLDTDQVSWGKVSAKQMNQYAIRQVPGPWNALGAVKFLFPNQYDVYLHDTPSKELFEKTTRAFSHGCIRVKNPMKLAAMLLSAEDPDWDEARVATRIEVGENSRVQLKSPVPIHIIYRTAWVESDGTVNFRSDLYHRDAKVAKLLYQR